MPQTIAARNISSRRSAHARLWILRRIRSSFTCEIGSVAVSNQDFGGYRETTLLKATTVHQEFRVLRRTLNVGVQKKFLLCNRCAGVEFPVVVKGLFRPHYVTWSEQLRIESHGPNYLANIVRIVTETGLRIYKELMPIRKENVDLANAVVWIPDSKKPNGIAEVPLTPLAIQAFRRQMAISGDGPFLVSK